MEQKALSIAHRSLTKKIISWTKHATYTPEVLVALQEVADTLDALAEGKAKVVPNVE